ncbi:protein FAM76A-like isoform X2 [Anneissia japonica]|uniref:protein FAM76A-like isoform X2 n=1 Tax=Anneissia japonica TaxID=1529436 RepID=UPI0014255313|nr:protein FAM76A-like isoform X2 [Anneissia japonica]
MKGDMSAVSEPLFACTKCNSRHPFEELSQGQQLCKECRGNYPVVKCTYCRAEFQQENKSNTNTICRKCSANVKTYGTPKPCEYCNVIAAFIGSKCQRCSNSEKKYGTPHVCEQCKQKCAFDRRDERKKVDGKILCWLCTLSYKRVLQKAKKRKFDLMSSHSSRSSSHDSKELNEAKEPRSKVSDKDRERSALHKIVFNASSETMKNEPGNSDHVVAMTQLREQVAALKKQVLEKDRYAIEKDKQIAELKASSMNAEKDLRMRITQLQKHHSGTIEELQLRNRTLNKQLQNFQAKNKQSVS